MSTDYTPELDASWHADGPDVQALQEVFGIVFNESVGQMESSEHRISLVGSSILSRYAVLTDLLHESLVVRDEGIDYPSVSGRYLYRELDGAEPFNIIHGLDYKEDMKLEIFPFVQNILNNANNRNKSIEEKLRVSAAVIGLVSAESQNLLNGNTRVARTIHDFIRDGYDGLQADRIADTRRHFTPPPAVEDLIMTQNVARVIGNREELPFGPGGVPIIRTTTRDSLARAEELRNRILGDKESLGGKSFFECVDIIEPFLDGVGQGAHEYMAIVLLQKQYGIAALAAAFHADLGENMAEHKLSPWAVQHLIETDRRLLRMRLLSLVRTVVNEGEVLSIGGKPYEEQRSLKRQTWWPSASDKLAS
jgi:hypothetical protein